MSAAQPQCSTRSLLCAGCPIVGDKGQVCWCWWARDRSSLRLSCPAEVLRTVWFQWHHTCDPGPSGIPRGAWGSHGGGTAETCSSPSWDVPRSQKRGESKAGQEPFLTPPQDPTSFLGVSENPSARQGRAGWRRRRRSQCLHPDRRVAVGKALRLTQEQQPSQRGQGTQSWDRAIPGLQQVVIQSSWGWKTAYSGQDSQDFPPCQLALEQLIKQALASL